MSVDSTKEEAIFDAASAIDDPVVRSQFLDRACADDGALRASVEELLSFHDTAGTFLETPPIGPVETAQAPIGAVIGRYKLLERIGEGGFGVVYRAEQQEPVRRQVAIKIIRLGMNTEHVISRFEGERQTLALMRHPNVATVLDAGRTESGRPYFVMELVEGQAIDEYCNTHRIGVRERLQLFLPVCRAIQHAHQKGIVHRDLKPSNVLVSRDDAAQGVPKVIDFGIAKAMHAPAVGPSQTDLRQFVGTPEYMSPEQITRDGADVDTRADIYALGGMLYQLLTGVTPLSGEAMQRGTWGDICRMITEVEPIRPSLRLAMTGDAQRAIAEQRDTQPATLRRALRGELDWIVMKALEKDRARRYETASDLARDIERYLDNRPVSARPPSRWYVAHKFIRRNRVAVAAAFLVVAALAVGGVLAGAGFIYAERERQHAEREWHRAEAESASAKGARDDAEQARGLAEQARESADRERQNAIAAAEKAQRVATLLDQLLGASNPEHGHAPDYTVRELLDDFTESLEQQLEGQPEIEASVRRTVGRSYLAIGDLARAGTQLERVLDLRRQMFGDEHVLTAHSRADFATYLIFVLRFDEAEQNARAAIETLGKLEPSRELAWAYNVLANIQGHYGDREAEGRYRREAWSLSEQVQGHDHRDTIMFQARAAAALSNRNRAEQLARDALDRMRTMRPAEHTDVALLESLLASILMRRRKLDESEQLLRHAMTTYSNSLGPNSYRVGEHLAILADLLNRMDRRDEAESAARAAVRIAEQASAGQSSLLSRAYRVVAVVLQPTNPAESADYFAKAIELRRQSIGDRPDVVPLLNRRANVLQELGRFDEAIACLREALAIRQKWPNQLIRLTNAHLRLVRVLHESGRQAEAKESLREAFTVFAGEEELPANRLTLVEALIDLGELQDARLELDKLERLNSENSDSLARPMTLTGRARFQMAQGDVVHAERQLREALELVTWSNYPRACMRTSIMLGQCLIQAKKFDEAAQLLLSLEQRSRRPTFDTEDTHRIMKLLVELYSARGKPEEADHWRRQLQLPDVLDD